MFPRQPRNKQSFEYLQSVVGQAQAHPVPHSFNEEVMLGVKTHLPPEVICPISSSVANSFMFEHPEMWRQAFEQHLDLLTYIPSTTQTPQERLYFADVINTITQGAIMYIHNQIILDKTRIRLTAQDKISDKLWAFAKRCVPELNNLPAAFVTKTVPLKYKSRYESMKSQLTATAMQNLNQGILPQKDLRLLRFFEFDYGMQILSLGMVENTMTVLVDFTLTKTSRPCSSLLQLKSVLSQDNKNNPDLMRDYFATKITQKKTHQGMYVFPVNFSPNVRRQNANCQVDLSPLPAELQKITR